MTKRYTHLAQQLSRVGGTPMESRRPSPLDAMEKKGVRLDVPRGGNRPRNMAGRFEAEPNDEPRPRAGRRGSVQTEDQGRSPLRPGQSGRRPTQPMDSWFDGDE